MGKRQSVARPRIRRAGEHLVTPHITSTLINTLDNLPKNIPISPKVLINLLRYYILTPIDN